jgi:hypothetical protein
MNGEISHSDAGLSFTVTPLEAAAAAMMIGKATSNPALTLARLLFDHWRRGALRA